MHNDQKSGKPSIDWRKVEKIENAISDDGRLTLDELSAKFPQICRSLPHETISQTLGYRKLSDRWVPKQLTDQHKFIRMEAGQGFLRRYKLHGEEFLRSIVSGDETWMHMGGKKVYNRREGEGRGGEVDERVGGKRIRGRHKKLIPGFTTCIEGIVTMSKIPYICTNVTG